MISTLTVVATALLMAGHPGQPGLPGLPPAGAPADTARATTRAATSEQPANAATMPWAVFWDQRARKDLRAICAKTKVPLAPPAGTTDSVQRPQPKPTPPAFDQQPTDNFWVATRPAPEGRCGGACVLGVAGVRGQSPGVAFSNLPDDVLADLGIRVENNVAYFQHNVKDRGWIDIAVGRNGATRTNSVSVDVEPHLNGGPLLTVHPDATPTVVRVARPNGGQFLTVYPWYVTDSQGRITTMFQLTGEDARKLEPGYFGEVVNRLAPISVQTGLQPTDVVVFWYEITPELLRILPQATAQDLRCSYQPWLTPETRKSHPANCAAPAPSRLTDAAVSLYPNPARGSFNLELQLPHELPLTVRLLDMSGREVRPLPNANVTGAGDLKLSFPLEGVAPGIYLVQLETPDGQRWSRRLIVEK